MHKLNTLFVSVLFCLATSVHADEITTTETTNSDGSKTITYNAPKQPWQVRRSQYIQDLQGVRNQDVSAVSSIRETLTEIEENQVSRTPLEFIEIFGSFYMANEGFNEIALKLMVTHQTLAWYDTLRYASRSGRAEILNNEQLFLKPWVISGGTVKNDLLAFIKNNPEKTNEIVQEALAEARQLRTLKRDESWPSAYGLENFTCVLSKQCPAKEVLPKSKWNQAWQDSEQKVSGYYLNKSL